MEGLVGWLQTVFFGAAPVSIHLRERRLHFALIVGATGLDDHLFSVPCPVEIETGMRLRKHRILDFGFLPALAAIDGYFYLADRAPARPRQPGNLVITGSGQLLSRRGARDHRLRRPHETVPARFVVQVRTRDAVVHALIPRHVGAIHHHDSPEPLDAVVGSKPGTNILAGK